MQCHQVDTWPTDGRRCPTKTLNICSCTFHSKAGCRSFCKADDQYRSLFKTLGTDRQKRGIIMIGHRPLCVYLTSSHVTRSSRPSPAISAYCKRSNTGSGNGLGMRLAHIYTACIGVTHHHHHGDGTKLTRAHALPLSMQCGFDVQGYAFHEYALHSSLLAVGYTSSDSTSFDCSKNTIVHVKSFYSVVTVTSLSDIIELTIGCNQI